MAVKTDPHAAETERADPVGAPGRVCVGAIAGAFGVRGDVRLKSFTADPEAIAAYGPLESEDGARRFTVRLTGAIKGGLSARLSGVDTREQAMALRGERLYAPRSALPPLEDEDEFYQADLIGLTVTDPGGAPLGRVSAVLNHGAGDLLEIAPAEGGPSALLPFTRDAVPTLDLRRGVLVADPPRGVFPGDDPEQDDDETGEAERNGEVAP